MWNITYNLNKLINPEKTGYEFITALKLYIPHKEIGLQLLVRKEQQLPFFYEVILKLVDCKCNEISNISELMGIEEEILIDIIAEMSRLELVYPKSSSISLTPKGKTALKELKSVVIEKEEMNRIYVNTITGKIVELEHTYKKPTDNNPCLNEIVKVTDEFISENFVNLNECYQRRQEEFGTRNSNVNVKNEIYQILGKEYERLCYTEKVVYIYRNTRDNDLIYECEGDPEGIYGTVFSKHIANYTGTRSFLKRYLDIQKYLDTKVVLDDEKKQNTIKLLEVIKDNNILGKGDTEELDKNYFIDRYMLQKEYSNILMSIKSIRPTEVIISSGCLSNILDHNVIANIQGNLDYSKTTIVGDNSEWKVDELKSRVLNYKQKKKNKIEWIESSDIKQTNIVLYPHCAITINYLPIAIGRDYLLREVAEITFNAEKIKEMKKNIYGDKYKDSVAIGKEERLY